MPPPMRAWRSRWYQWAIGISKVSPIPPKTCEDLHDLVDTAPAPFTGAVLDHGCLHSYVITGVSPLGNLPSSSTERDDIGVDVGQHVLYGLISQSAFQDLSEIFFQPRFQRIGSIKPLFALDRIYCNQNPREFSPLKSRFSA